MGWDGGMEGWGENADNCNRIIIKIIIIKKNFLLSFTSPVVAGNVLARGHLVSWSRGEGGV